MQKVIGEVKRRMDLGVAGVEGVFELCGFVFGIS